MNPPAALVQIGLIGAAHGLRGQVKLRSLTENPRDIYKLSPITDQQGRVYALKGHGGHEANLIASIEGVDDRHAAEALRNTALYAPAAALPETDDNQWYYAELTGLEARLVDGNVYGRVMAVENYGAGDLLDIQRGDGSSEMLPLTDAFVGDIMVEEGYLVVFPPEYAEPEGGHE